MRPDVRILVVTAVTDDHVYTQTCDGGPMYAPWFFLRHGLLARHLPDAPLVRGLRFAVRENTHDILIPIGTTNAD